MALILPQIFVPSTLHPKIMQKWGITYPFVAVKDG